MITIIPRFYKKNRSILSSYFKYHPSYYKTTEVKNFFLIILFTHNIKINYSQQIFALINEYLQ